MPPNCAETKSYITSGHYLARHQQASMYLCDYECPFSTLTQVPYLLLYSKYIKVLLIHQKKSPHPPFQPLFMQKIPQARLLRLTIVVLCTFCAYSIQNMTILLKNDYTEGFRMFRISDMVLNIDFRDIRAPEPLLKFGF